MNKSKLTLGMLLIGLAASKAHSQVYSQVPLLFTNTLASSSGGASLFGVPLDPNTTVSGGISFVLGGNTSQILLTLSDGSTSVNEAEASYTSGYSLTQDLINHTLTITSVGSTPWGGLFQDEVFLPAGAMRSDAASTFQYVVFGNGGRYGLAPGVTYGQYSSDVTISDGTTTGIFDPTPAPEPGTMALALMGGLAGLFAFQRRS